MSTTRNCRSRSHARWPFAIVNDTRRRSDQEPALHHSKGLTRDRVKLIHLTAIRGKNGKTR